MNSWGELGSHYPHGGHVVMLGDALAARGTGIPGGWMMTLAWVGYIALIHG